MRKQYLTRAINVLERGYWQEGLLLADRGLSQDPLDASALFDFVEQASIIAARNEENLVDCLMHLESLVRGRVMFADLADVDAIIACADSLSARRSARLQGVEEPPTHAEAERTDLITAARRGTLAEVVEASEDLQQLREALESAREISEGEPVAREALRSAIEDTELAASLDQTASEARTLMERVGSWSPTRPNIARAGIALQHIEGMLRPFAAFSHRLDPRRIAVTDELLEQLRQVATHVAKQALDTDAAERWGAFEREHEKTVYAAFETPPPKVDEPDRHYQGRLDQIHLVQEKLLPLFAAFLGSETWTRAREYAGRLARRGHELAQQQQQRYDRWALAQIRRGYGAASPHIGTVTDDEEKIARAMSSAFGAIDVRVLGYEAQRSFNELFDLLYQHLHRPKKQADLDAWGGKVHLLSQMLRTPKRALTEF